MKQLAEQTHQPCVDFTTGDITWDWPEMSICKQKLVRSELFDPHKEFSKRGAHMPLMVFIVDKNKQRRSHEARGRRDSNAEHRGWDAARRTPWKFHGTKGKGETTRGGGGKAHSYAGSTQLAGPRDPNAWEWPAASSNWNSWSWS